MLRYTRSPPCMDIHRLRATPALWLSGPHRSRKRISISDSYPRLFPLPPFITLIPPSRNVFLLNSPELRSGVTINIGTARSSMGRYRFEVSDRRAHRRFSETRRQSGTGYDQTCTCHYKNVQIMSLEYTVAFSNNIEDPSTWATAWGKDRSLISFRNQSVAIMKMFNFKSRLDTVKEMKELSFR